MPYTLNPAANAMAIAEREYGSAQNAIQFTAFTSCIGVVSMTGNVITGVHLSISDQNGQLFTDATVPLVMAALGADYTDAFIIGRIAFWENPENGVSQAYDKLVQQVRAGAQLQNFNTYPLGDGTYGADIQQGRLSPTFV